MAYNLQKAYEKAKAEGRLCSRCGWMITVINWRRGDRLCAGCKDALQGVNITYGHHALRDEPDDDTGDSV